MALPLAMSRGERVGALGKPCPLHEAPCIVQPFQGCSFISVSRDEGQAAKPGSQICQAFQARRVCKEAPVCKRQRAGHIQLPAAQPRHDTESWPRFELEPSALGHYRGNWEHAGCWRHCVHGRTSEVKGAFRVLVCRG